MFAKKMVFLGVVMLLISFIAPTWANVVSPRDSFRSGYGFVAASNDRKSQIDHIVRGIGKPKLQQDAYGRISRIEIERGDFVEFRYDHDGQAIPHKSMLNGKHYGPKATAALLKAFQIRQPLRFAGASNNIYQVKGSAPGSSRAEFGFQKAQFVNGQNEQELCQGNQQCLQDLEDKQCAMDPTCFGIWDSINSFVGSFANWLGVSAALGGTIGAVIGVLEGAGAAAVLTATGLGAVGATAIVVAFTGGYLIGTAINGGIEWVIYR